jgi:putative ABC transport system ATP-binding protein
MNSPKVNGLHLDQVTVIRGRARLLDGICTQISSSRCTAVVGPSGAGKSTLLRLLNRLDEPRTGRILFEGVPVAEVDVLTLRRRIGLVAQHPVLLTDHVTDELRVGRPELTQSRIDELLQRVGLPARFAQWHTGELSGGEAQRVCLARTLAVEPEVLLLDEPTSALDGVSATVIADLARDHVESGGTVVLASHDLDVVRGVADQVLVLDHGHLVAAGPPDTIAYVQAR